MSKALLSADTLIESPFIIVTIGEYTFGHYSSTGVLTRGGSASTVTYPNFMKSIKVVKINGAVNTYTINMLYAITAGDDPNLLEKVFGTASKSRKIKISYGDWSDPTFRYKEEEAIITNVQSRVDFAGSTITYIISCTSTALSLRASNFDFPKRTEKPSEVLKEMLVNKKYGLQDVFYGMSNIQKVTDNNLIIGDDKTVTIEARKSTNPLDYMNYLVSNMSSLSDTSTGAIKQSRYFLSVVDELSPALGGPYFKVTKVNTGESLSNVSDLDTYEIDIGYPQNHFVTSFSLKTDQSWAILYDYSQEVQQSNYIYRIDDQGRTISELSPSISNSKTLMKTTETNKSWWTAMTQFPVSATLTVKGLMRPTILMSYLKLNCLFYGQKHVSSGLYIITRQEDTIDDHGYKTTLSLTRIKGD